MNRLYPHFGKRLLDLALVAVVLTPSLVICAFVAIVVRLFLGSPVVFRQLRAGRNGRLFTLYKFRTMTQARDAEGRLLPDDRRLTKLGAILRKTSLDELPQVWNVLRGDMSLIGPRPLLPSYLARYSPTQMRRHELRPGITGWAQVNGRNGVDWDERLQCDVWYVEHASLWLDVKILAMTALRVLVPRGINADGHATMPEFMGSVTAGAAVGGDGVLVIGASGHAKVVIATLEAQGRTIAGVYDDNPHLWGKMILGHTIRGPLSKLVAMRGTPAVIAIGDATIRSRIASQLPLNWISAVHPAATVHSSVRMGEGTVVFAGAVVQPDVALGQHVIVNTGATVDHDCVVGNFTSIGPGAHLAGAVRLGAYVELGTGCAVIPLKQIGDASVVGAGAVVVEDVAEGVVVAGCPARVLRSDAPRILDASNRVAA